VTPGLRQTSGGEGLSPGLRQGAAGPTGPLWSDFECLNETTVLNLNPTRTDARDCD